MPVKLDARTDRLRQRAIPVIDRQQADSSKDRLKTVYFRRESDRFGRYREEAINRASPLNQPILEGDEEMLDFISAVGRSKMIVLGFCLLLCRERPESIPCLLDIDRQPNGSDGSIATS